VTGVVPRFLEGEIKQENRKTGEQENLKPYKRSEKRQNFLFFAIKLLVVLNFPVLRFSCFPVKFASLLNQE
jgi:hypothetical protein